MGNDLSFQELVLRISRQRGFDLRGYKASTLQRRLRKRMNALNVERYTDYLDRFEADPTEANELLNTVLINVTEFFRDAPAWEYLRVNVLPNLLSRDARSAGSFRAWSAGCSTGEEAYSLALLIANQLGDGFPDLDLKIYATDVDEDALNVARRGEYPLERLRKVPEEWRTKYFHSSGSMYRINRDLRRMLIFGRSSLVQDAPISHCKLVICRNVLIYLDQAAQKQVFSRLQYALDPHGVLFLGKAESKLSQSEVFKPLSPRWRIFQKVASTSARNRYEQVYEEGVMSESGEVNDKTQQELRMLKLYQQHILDTLKSGVVFLDREDNVIQNNEAALRIWGITSKLKGRRLQNAELVLRCPELIGRLEESRQSENRQVNFECRTKVNGEERMVSLVIQPIMEDGARTGTLIYCEDSSHHERLQSTIEQLEATGEELQSANEELETTNEELQSTNEELETTNEELQSTNEELETTNEELHSLNEELENMNEELERRSRELNDLTTRYAETLQRMPWPVMLVDHEKRIQLWNAAAQRLFGVGATSVVGVDIEQLPLYESLRKAIVRRCEAVSDTKKPSILRDQAFKADHMPGSMEVHFTPITGTQHELEGVLIMFGPFVPVELPKKHNRGENSTKRGNKSPNSHGKKAVKKSSSKKSR